MLVNLKTFTKYNIFDDKDVILLQYSKYVFNVGSVSVNYLVSIDSY